MEQGQQTQTRGWGSWGLSALSDLHIAAEEISKNAMEAAKGAAKGIADLQSTLAESLSGKSQSQDVNDGRHDSDLDTAEKLRRDALHRLEAASRDSSIGHGLKVLDSSMDSLASEAYQVLGDAWKGGMGLVHRLESSAEQLAGSVHKEGLTAAAGALAPKLIQGGKELTAKSIRALEYVGKETLEILALDDAEHRGDDGETGTEDLSFDHCFYIYGGPEHLEELEALCTHCTLVCNRAKLKMSQEGRAVFDELCKQIPQVLTLGDGGDSAADKGKQIETGALVDGGEMKSLREASVSKAADMATNFTATLGGLAVGEVVQKTSGRIEAIKAEGIHRLSEVCAVCMSHLTSLGRSLLAGRANESSPRESGGDVFEWPEDCLSKAHVIRGRALNMATDLEAVSDSFITGIGDVVAAFQVAKDEVVGVDGRAPAPGGYNSIEDKARALCSDLQTDGTAALDKLQHGLEQLVHVLLSTAAI